MTLLDELEPLIRDGLDNFENGRLDDAYHHFDSISRLFFQNEDVANGLYFSYRAILCKSSQINSDNIRDFVKLGVFLIKYAMTWANDRINHEQDPWKVMKLLEIQDQLVEDLDLSSLSEPIKSSLAQVYRTVVDEHDLDHATRSEIYEKLIELDKSSDQIKQNYFSHLSELARQMPEDEINIYPKLQHYRKLRDLASSDHIDSISSEISRLEDRIDEL